jgi:hypothetical protein
MTVCSVRLKLWLPLLGGVVACSDFFGSGPDPSRAGPFTGSSGRSAGGASDNLGGSGTLGGKGNGNTGGSNPTCPATDPLGAVLAIANAACADVQSCAQKSCNAQAQQCLGSSYQRGTVSGACKGFVDCSSGCSCNDNCTMGCTNTGQNATCLDCLLTLQDCVQASCSDPLQVCQDQSGKPTVLTVALNTNVNALALDDSSLYFTTNTGIAKIPKTGGKAQALGGFNNPNGLAVAAGFIYVVIDAGAVSRIKIDGSQPTTIVTSMFGGGPGPIVIDDANLYYLSGSDVRRAPITGGAASRLADDVWQQGFNGGQRLAIDATSMYYVGGGTSPGAKPQLSMVNKDAAGIGQDMPGVHSGTSLVEADGEIRGIVSDDKFVYFADLASDGLKMALEIRKLDPKSLKTSKLASVAPMNNTGGSVAIATDGTSVFFGGGSGLYSVPVGGGSVATLDATAQPSAMVLDDSYLYWAEQNNNGVIKRMPKLGPP